MQSLDAVPTLEEIQKAISLLSTGKAPGGDSIPAEIYKEGDMALVGKLRHLFKLIWNQWKVPQAQSSTCTSEREIDRPATTTVSSTEEKYLT